MRNIPAESIIHGAFFLAHELIAFLSSEFGVIEIGTRKFLFVTGHLLFPLANRFSSAHRSHVVPVARMTGSLITLPDMGQINLGGALASMAIRSSSRTGDEYFLGDPEFFPAPLDLAATVCPDVELPPRREDLGVRRLGVVWPYFSVVDKIPRFIDPLFISLRVRSSEHFAVVDVKGESMAAFMLWLASLETGRVAAMASISSLGGLLLPSDISVE